MELSAKVLARHCRLRLGNLGTVPTILYQNTKDLNFEDWHCAIQEHLSQYKVVLLFYHFFGLEILAWGSSPHFSSNKRI